MKTLNWAGVLEEIEHDLKKNAKRGLTLAQPSGILKVSNEWEMIEMNIEKQCKEALKKFEDMYYYIGIRFEDKDREVGEICECSKHNLDREDEREFPVYGTPEYDELPELDGTSAWNLETCNCECGSSGKNLLIGSCLR